jgi:hypothetical protein
LPLTIRMEAWRRDAARRAPLTPEQRKAKTAKERARRDARPEDKKDAERAKSRTRADRHRRDITDTYVRQIFRLSSNLNPANLTREFIDAKRAHLKLKRYLKEKCVEDIARR